MPVRAGRQQHAGLALVVTLLAMVLMVVFVALAFSASNMTNQVAVRSRTYAVAEQAARAGLAEAMYYLSLTPNWTAGLSKTLPSSGGSYTVTFDNRSAAWSTNNTFSSATQTGYDGRSVPGGAAHLVCTGSYLGVSVVSQALVKNVSAINYSATSDVYTYVYSSIFDSFNSTTGTGPVNAGASIFSNGSAFLSVYLNNSTVYGTVTTGPQSANWSYFSISSTLTGGATAASKELSLTSLTAPSATSKQASQNLYGGNYTLAPGTYGDVQVNNGATLNLQCGNYVFDSLYVAGSSTIHLPSTEQFAYVYVQGALQITDSAVANDARVPSHFWLVECGNNNVYLDSVGTMYGVVYAPNSYIGVSANNSATTMYGAVIASQVQFQSMRLHYDTALKTAPGPLGTLTMLARWGD